MAFTKSFSPPSNAVATSIKTTPNSGDQVEEKQREINNLRKSRRAQKRWNEMLKTRVDTLMREQSAQQDTEVMLRASVHLLEEKEEILKAAVEKLESRAGAFEDQVQDVELDRDSTQLELEAVMRSYQSLRNQCEERMESKSGES